MRITHKQDTSKESCTLDPNGEVLKSEKSIKDLGITTSYDLSWSDHIHDVVNKAHRVLGVIKRVLGSKSTTEFSLLYKSLVRPILEYAAPVWCPFLVKDIVLLEKVQRRASRLALGQKRGEIYYEERCAILKWSPSEKRRLYFSLIECYKCLLSLNNLEFQVFFPSLPRKEREATIVISYNLKHLVVTVTNIHFFIRIVK